MPGMGDLRKWESNPKPSNQQQGAPSAPQYSPNWTQDDRRDSGGDNAPKAAGQAPGQGNYARDMGWGGFGNYGNWYDAFQSAHYRPPNARDEVDYWDSQLYAAMNRGQGPSQSEWQNRWYTRDWAGRNPWNQGVNNPGWGLLPARYTGGYNGQGATNTWEAGFLDWANKGIFPSNDYAALAASGGLGPYGFPSVDWANWQRQFTQPGQDKAVTIKIEPPKAGGAPTAASLGTPQTQLYGNTLPGFGSQSGTRPVVQAPPQSPMNMYGNTLPGFGMPNNWMQIGLNQKGRAQKLPQMGR